MDAAQGRDPEDFEWQKQARFYWRHDFDHAQTSIADVDFKYMNAYLGVKEPRRKGSSTGGSLKKLLSFVLLESIACDFERRAVVIFILVSMHSF